MVMEIFVVLVSDTAVVPLALVGNAVVVILPLTLRLIVVA